METTSSRDRSFYIGRMLRLAHTFLRESGLLFLAVSAFLLKSQWGCLFDDQLPLPCIENSRYLTFELLQSLMATIGFVETHKKWKQGGKMAYWLYRKVEKDTCSDFGPFRRRTTCRLGN